MKTKVTPARVRTPVSGFTLIELMIAVAILAILVGIAAPNFREAVLNARMTAQANDLMADLNVARSEAVKRGANVYLCTSSNGTSCTATEWRLGWLIFVDTDASGNKQATELVLKSRPAVDSTNQITPTGDIVAGGIHYVRYHPSGAANVAGNTIVFAMCDLRYTANAAAGMNAQRADNRGRTIQIAPSGRPVATRRTCATATS
jgi:type IV fimbrial biogenesis protein FimT